MLQKKLRTSTQLFFNLQKNQQRNLPQKLLQNPKRLQHFNRTFHGNFQRLNNRHKLLHRLHGKHERVYFFSKKQPEENSRRHKKQLSILQHKFRLLRISRRERSPQIRSVRLHQQHRRNRRLHNDGARLRRQRLARRPHRRARKEPLFELGQKPRQIDHHHHRRALPRKKILETLRHQRRLRKRRSWPKRPSIFYQAIGAQRRKNLRHQNQILY